MSSLYLPGRGMVDLAAAAVDRAVRQYDERLLYHPSSPQTGQPTVFIRMEADNDTGFQIDGNNVFPVLAFNLPPAPEYAVTELSKRDSLRHGLKLVDDIHDNNEKIKAEKRAAAEEAEGIAAEAYEWYLRNTGQTSHKRVYMSGRKGRS